MFDMGSMLLATLAFAIAWKIYRAADQGRAMPFKKGQSGNPGGRARGYHEFAARAREMSVEGLEQLYAFANDKRQNVQVRIRAWKTIMERGFGKAV
jgi:hypothetical protein